MKIRSAQIIDFKEAVKALNKTGKSVNIDVKGVADSFAPALKTKGYKMFGKEVPAELKDLFKKFVGTKNADEIFYLFQEAKTKVPGLKQIDPATLQFRDFQIQNALTFYAESNTANMKIANVLKLKSAPTMLRHVSTGEGESLLLTKLHKYEGADLQPILDLKKAPENALKDIFSDFKKLAMNNFVFDEGKTGSRLYVNSKTGALAITDWSSLRTAQSKEEAFKFFNKYKAFIDSLK